MNFAAYIVFGLFCAVFLLMTIEPYVFGGQQRF